MVNPTDVWTLETPGEDEAANTMEPIIDSALSGNESSQEYLRMLWDNESWASIKAKLETEGSTWYVWWMDGVRKQADLLQFALDTT